MKLAIATTAVLAAIATAAHANTYTDMCRAGDKSYPVKVTSMSMASSGPSTRGAAQSAAMPYTAASEFDGVIARHHRIAYPSS